MATPENRKRMHSGRRRFVQGMPGKSGPVVRRFVDPESMTPIQKRKPNHWQPPDATSGDSSVEGLD